MNRAPMSYNPNLQVCRRSALTAGQIAAEYGKSNERAHTGLLAASDVYFYRLKTEEMELTYKLLFSG